MSPRERTILRALWKEGKLKQSARRNALPFRSWTQQRVRRFQLNTPTTLHAVFDPSLRGLMDGAYLAACLQKAAALRKHDTKLWHGLAQRTLEVFDSITPEQMGYCLYGFGKSQWMKFGFYQRLFEALRRRGVGDFPSHALMMTAWTLYRLAFRNEPVLRQVAEAAVARADLVRPADLIKLANACARQGIFSETLPAQSEEEAAAEAEATFLPFTSSAPLLVTEGQQLPEDVRSGSQALGVSGLISSRLRSLRGGTSGSSGLKTRLSEAVMDKLQDMRALDAREAMCDVAVVNLYEDDLKRYILERFSKIFIVCRPKHLQQAYRTAVAVRVLRPELWESLPRKVKAYYVRLSMRKINMKQKFPSSLQWSISRTLAAMGIKHRNTFTWGSHWVDISELSPRLVHSPGGPTVPEPDQEAIEAMQRVRRERLNRIHALQPLDSDLAEDPGGESNENSPPPPDQTESQSDSAGESEGHSSSSFGESREGAVSVPLGDVGAVPYKVPNLQGEAGSFESLSGRVAWFVDGPSNFYSGSLKYKEAVKLKHKVLSLLGWEIRRIRWDEWLEVQLAEESEERRKELVRKKRMESPLPPDLPDPSSRPPEEVIELLRKRATRKKEMREKYGGASPSSLILPQKEKIEFAFQN
uniref:RAP domain-containing protein n=1 Tax=Chromera velia CCMP2878 TaxID=1169474 RepID=A0A0G4I116_9ALVE|eukprot:Cvel_10043.t1-p1 / transcript=Cvel_10043.t1 / gene=Cvel_10043 / organism=Chromera_velia_CCMP2878 / gene_product=hypothetical protein / transcript_product=hypothetical protein / location=Cvel_scaffold597:50359-55456(-) / protein_length=641 / sequence_SO=supercontig / SO=protein_coding / is_pseudo=false